MASVTSWTRLEPHARSEEMGNSLEAKLYDPLWLLARQWQFGEFQGEDSGSPIFARVSWTEGMISRLKKGRLQNAENTWDLYDAAKTPLETIVEKELVHCEGLAPQMHRIEAGLHFLRFLEAKGLREEYGAAFSQAYPLNETTTELTNDSGEYKRLQMLFLGRVPDGQTLFQAVQSLEMVTLPPRPSILETDKATALDALTEWVAWYKDLFDQPELTTSAWIPERFEYEFSLAASLAGSESRSGDPVVLAAPGYRGNQLDWHAFTTVVGDATALGKVALDAAISQSRTAYPTPVIFSGMPRPRFWEIEDSHINFGQVDAGPEDLSRLLLIEFALIYGNDFFSIPLELPVGRLYRIDTLKVTDSFGNVTAIPSVTDYDGSTRFSMFTLGPDPRFPGQESEQQLFFLPPSIIHKHASPELEKVLFARDEMANISWAIEQTVEGPLGNGIQRAEKETKGTRDASSSASKSAQRAYRLAVEPPTHWFPFSVKNIGDALSPQNVFQLKLRAGSERQPWGCILSPYTQPGMQIPEEEIPREGVIVTRAYDYTRWTNGSTHLWMGRRKQTGRGESGSGLKFDFLE